MDDDAIDDTRKPHQWWSGWSVFASSDPAAPERRPTDAVLLVVAIALLGWTAWRADPSGQFDSSLAEALTSMPSFFDPLWQVSIDLIMVWCVVLIAAAAIARRFRLLLQFALAGALTLVAVSVVGRLAVSDWPDLWAGLSDTDGPPLYPAERIALVAALAITASPELGRPFRRLGRVLLPLAALAAVALEITLPGGAVGGYAIGLAVASLVHLGFGSPGWRPNTNLVVTALERVGLRVRIVGPASFVGGVATIPAIDQNDRRLVLQVHGRDAWQGQFFSSLVRFMAYRDAGPNFTTGRAKQVEHEAFVTLLAERSGASVAGVVTAVETLSGDAVLVVEDRGTSIEDSDAGDLPSDFPSQLWSSLLQLHDASIAHGRIDHESVVFDSNGRASLVNFAAASVSPESDRVRADDAQALALTASLLDPQTAVDAAVAAIGPDAVGELVPYLQRPVMSPTLRAAVKSGTIDLDDLRARSAAAGGVEEPELAKLRRVTWGSLVQVALVLIAAWVVISAISSVGLSTLWDTLKTAQWQWVVVALILSQLARVPSGVATMGATIRAVRLWPAVALDFAVAFVNLAIPATAARVAVKVRFFQRHGASAPEALSIGVLDTVVNTGLQALILILVPLLGLGSLDLNADLSFGDHTEAAIIVLALLVIAVLLTIFVDRIHDWVLPPLKHMIGAFTVLRSPQKVVMLVGGNLGAQIGFALGIWASLEAFGQSVSIVQLLFINAAVSLLAGLLPIPGGIGVSEAALAAGFVAVGVPSSIAASAAILYRITSFYVPPMGGYFCMKWLQKNDML